MINIYFSRLSDVVVRCSGGGKLWNTLKYHGIHVFNLFYFVVFDAPSLDLPFEGRMKRIQDHFKKNQSEWVEIVEQTKCENRAQLESKLKDVEELGGEGLMLRKAGSNYVEGKQIQTN